MHCLDQKDKCLRWITRGAGGIAGFFDPHGWCDERKVPLVLDGTQRQSSAQISLDPIRSNITKTTNTKRKTTGQQRDLQDEEYTAASCVELMIVNEFRGAEGEFWLTLHSSSGEINVEQLSPPLPTPQQAAAMARNIDQTTTKHSAATVCHEEEEVGAELIAVLSQQQRWVSA